MSVVLPNELMDRVIDHLHDDQKTLSACALVCSSWLPAVRSHRFRHVRVWPRTLAAFHTLLQASPDLPLYVANLRIVIAALLPMLFVSGMMGPYMAPIPTNASAAMLFSFFVAVMLTPWLMMKFSGSGNGGLSHAHGDSHISRLGRMYMAVARPLLIRRWRS